MSADPKPEFIPRELAEQEDQLAAVRSIARLLDTAYVIPGINVRVGWDSILGLLLPGVGDVVGLAAGGYILWTAARLGVPRPVLARMLANVAADAALGAVPLVGDVADVVWKANTRNVALLESAVADPAAARRGSAWYLVGIVALLALLLAGTIALGVWLAGLLTKTPG
jgi:hypothetical protein